MKFSRSYIWNCYWIVDVLTKSNKDTKISIQTLVNSDCAGDMIQLADKINVFYQSISVYFPLITHPIVITVSVQDKYIISVEDTEKQLMQMRLHKTPGCSDGLPNWVLKDCASTLTGPITSIVNSSIRETYFPSIWKSGGVTPMPNINPPKLTPSVSKSCLNIVHYSGCGT